MKLKDLLEDTCSGAVATYNKPLNEKEPIKRIGFMKYALDKNCKGCEIIKNYAFKEPNTGKRELTCSFCGAVHTKKG
jgi:flavoprotein